MASTITALTSGGGIALSGDTSGNLSLQTANGTYTATVPQGNGTIAVQGVSTNIVSGSAVASTSGTFIDFTSIPSWVKRITVMFQGVSISGTANQQIQIGSGSVTTTGYTNFASSTSNVNATNTGGFLVTVSGTAADTVIGSAVLTLISGNTWVYCSNITRGSASQSVLSGGYLALSGALDRVRITTTNGTDTFDAGTINILYE